MSDTLVSHPPGLVLGEAGGRVEYQNKECIMHLNSRTVQTILHGRVCCSPPSSTPESERLYALCLLAAGSRVTRGRAGVRVEGLAVTFAYRPR
jgi:hypothetical protein